MQQAHAVGADGGDGPVFTAGWLRPGLPCDLHGLQVENLTAAGGGGGGGGGGGEQPIPVLGTLMPSASTPAKVTVVHGEPTLWEQTQVQKEAQHIGGGGGGGGGAATMSSGGGAAGFAP